MKMKQGDVVVIIDGAELPFVLRPMEGERWELIGFGNWRESWMGKRWRGV